MCSHVRPAGSIAAREFERAVSFSGRLRGAQSVRSPGCRVAAVEGVERRRKDRSCRLPGKVFEPFMKGARSRHAASAFRIRHSRHDPFCRFSSVLWSALAAIGVTDRLYGWPKIAVQGVVKWATASDDAGAGQRRSESEGGCRPAVNPARRGVDRRSMPSTRSTEPPFPQLPRRAQGRTVSFGRTAGCRSVSCRRCGTSVGSVVMCCVCVLGDAIRDGRP